MAEKTDKKTDKNDKNGHRNWNFEKRGVSDYVPSPKTLQIICLKRIGWSVRQVAQACCVSERQVYRQLDEAKDFLDKLPEIQAAKDAIQSLIPKAIEVYEESLKGKSKILAADIATKILISNKVTTDRKVIEDVREQSTDKLLEELDKIQSSFAYSTTGTRQAGSDSDGSSRS